MSRKTVFIAILVMAGLAAMILPARALDVQSVVFKKGSLPKGWELTRNYTAPPGKLPQLEKRFGIKPLLGLVNQVFIVEGKYRLQVNFVQCKNKSQAKSTALKMKKMVGHMNRILLRDNVVIEIMTRPDNPGLKNKVTRMLSPAREVN